MQESDVLQRQTFIINAALTGMLPRKSDTPYVPVTPEEIAEDAAAVVEAGAAIVHLHPRDTEGNPSCDPGLFAEVISGVRERCPDVIICGTCSGRIESDIERRAACLTLEGDLKPDMGSLTCGSLNFPNQPSINAPETIIELARRMKERGIKPEVEVFEPGMIHFAKYLVKKGILDEPLYVNILLGNLGTSPATALDLALMVNALPEGTVWAAAGIGRYQLWANAMALAMGGNVRVGIEDNLYYDWQNKSLATNRALVERVVRIGRELGRRPATCKEARELLGLPPRGAAS